MRDSLRRAGFKVTMVRDAGILKMRKAIIDFGNALDAGAVGLFYYSGHGIQLAGANYMVPVDAMLRKRDYAAVEAVNLNEVLTRMGAAENRLNIVILDACRNNPFPSFKKAASRGLAVTQAPGGTYIAYATGPGSVADDGDGRNSPFTTALASTIGERGLHLDGVFNKVRAKVMAATKNAQTPWSSSSVTGDFYFHLPSQPDPNQQAAATWALIKDTMDTAVIEKFVEIYPDSSTAPAARRRLKQLGKDARTEDARRRAKQERMRQESEKTSLVDARRREEEKLERDKEEQRKIASATPSAIVQPNPAAGSRFARKTEQNSSLVAPTIHAMKKYDGIWTAKFQPCYDSIMDSEVDISLNNGRALARFYPGGRYNLYATYSQATSQISKDQQPKLHLRFSRGGSTYEILATFDVENAAIAATFINQHNKSCNLKLVRK